MYEFEVDLLKSAIGQCMQVNWNRGFLGYSTAFSSWRSVVPQRNGILRYTAAKLQNPFNVTLFSLKNQLNAFTVCDKLRHVSA